MNNEQLPYELYSDCKKSKILRSAATMGVPTEATKDERARLLSMCKLASSYRATAASSNGQPERRARAEPKRHQRHTHSKQEP